MSAAHKMGAFDAHHPPAADLINQCVHCGFCLPACPTYALWGEEMDSPRGRIYLIKMASEGATTMTENWVRHFDTCLGCVSCMTACPSGVDYGKLIEATRAQIERLHPRPLGERLHRGMIFALFPKIGRLRLLRGLLSFYQKSGTQGFVRASRILKLFPARLQAMETLAPKVVPREEVARRRRPPRGSSGNAWESCWAAYSVSFYRQSTPRRFAYWQRKVAKWSRRRNNRAAAR